MSVQTADIATMTTTSLWLVRVFERLMTTDTRASVVTAVVAQTAARHARPFSNKVVGVFYCVVEQVFSDAILPCGFFR
jgi:hypothetical protein